MPCRSTLQADALKPAVKRLQSSQVVEGEFPEGEVASKGV